MKLNRQLAPKRQLRPSSTQAAIVKLLEAGSFMLDYYARVLLGYDAARRLRRLRAPGIPIENDPDKVRGSMYHLKRNKYITLTRISEKRYKLELTPEGRRLFKEYNFYEVKISPPRHWDGKWRIVAFDIPEKNKTTRDIFRRRLKELGFFQFQKSFWIYPFRCEKEIHYLCEHLGIHHYVFVFTGKFARDKLLQKYFRRKKILKTSHLRFLIRRP